MICSIFCLFSLLDKSAKLQEGGLHEATPQVIHFILTYLFSAKDLFGKLIFNFKQVVVPIIIYVLR